MVASGFAALGYQIVWTQQSALWLGHESAAVLAVVAAFFGGLAVGALAARPAHRSQPAARALVRRRARPRSALWSLALAFLMAPVGAWLLDLIGAQPSPAWHWAVAFCGTFLLLLPATAAMGATLPAMERVLATLRGRGIADRRAVRGQYVRRRARRARRRVLAGAASSACAHAPCVRALNLLCAAARAEALCRARARARIVDDARPDARARSAVAGCHRPARDRLRSARRSRAEPGRREHRLHVRDPAGGVPRRHGARRRRVRPLAVARGASSGCATGCCGMLAAACLLGTLSLAARRSRQGVGAARAGHRHGGGARRRGALATAAFLLPTIVMGALFSHLGTHARAAGISFGRALGVNTLGAAARAAAVRRVAAAGARPEVRAAARRRRLSALCRRGARGRAPAQWATAGATLALASGRRRWRSSTFPKAGGVVSYRGRRDGDGQRRRGRRAASRRLHINNRQQEGSSATLLADARQALLPLLLHPAPRRALFLGLGTGVTASVGGRGSDAAGRRGRAAAGGHRRVGALHAHARRRATRACT